MEVYYCKVLICKVKYYLKVNYDKLKIATINPKATTEITK